MSLIMVVGNGAENPIGDEGALVLCQELARNCSLTELHLDSTCPHTAHVRRTGYWQ